MTENDYKSLPDYAFRTQYDVTPRDAQVEALLSGIEPEVIAEKPSDRPAISVSMPAPQFTWLKPLR